MSAPVNAGQRRSTPPATGQRRRFTVVIGGQRRSTLPATGQRRRITVVIGDQRWRSTTVAGGKPPLTAAGPPLTTTGKRWLVGWSTLGTGLVWIGSGSGPGQVWAGSATWHATCAHVSATCANVASTWMLTWIIGHIWESNPVP
nr:hypothetical protein [Tanacetum cinerariifolium]